MPERQNFRCAPGDDCLPDLTITMPIDYDRMNSTLPDKRLVDSALEELLAQYESSRNKRDRRVIDHVSHKRNTEASVSKGHTAYHLRFGDQTPGQTRDSAAWPGHNNSACASCSKWSLACIHAAALNAFDEHDSDSDERQAVTVVQQPMCLQKGCADASRRSQQQAYHRLGSPMLQRWLSQSPRQEGFNGVATAQVLSRSATKSRL